MPSRRGLTHIVRARASSDQLHRLKPELARKSPSLYDLPPGSIMIPNSVSSEPAAAHARLRCPNCSRDRAVEPDHKRHRVLRIHYAETLHAWRSNLFAKRKELHQAV